MCGEQLVVQMFYLHLPQPFLKDLQVPSDQKDPRDLKYFFVRFVDLPTPFSYSKQFVKYPLLISKWLMVKSDQSMSNVPSSWRIKLFLYKCMQKYDDKR